MSIFVFLAAIGVIAVTYSPRMKDPAPLGASPFYRFRFLLVLVALLFGPLLFVTLFFPRTRAMSAQERLEIAEKYNKKHEKVAALRSLAKIDRYNINAQIEFIDYNFKIAYNSIYLCSDLSKVYKNRNDLTAHLSQWYIDKKCNSRTVADSVLNEFHEDTLGVNYLRGYAAQARGDLDAAELYYSAEIAINPTLSASYKKLFEIYQASNLDVLAVLMKNPTFTQHIDPQVRRVYYYKFGYSIRYLKEVFNLIDEIPRWSTFLIALLSSVIWVGYLWMMDIYNREKWYDILAVFLLGSIATLGVTVFYDFFSWSTDFELNGGAINDFLYCTFVIGGSEEIIKFLPWIIYGTLFKKFKEPFDYILYASISALGFAFVENFIYFENFYNIVIRTMMSTVSHIFDATIIAFAFIIVRYRMPKHSPYKIVVLIAGFLVAMLAHGFYDFWLINKNYSQYSFLTYLFYFISLHIWFYFKNNAMNHSPYFCDSIQFDRYKKQDYINFTMVFVLILQYVVVSYEFGSAYGVYVFQLNVVFLTLFILYMFYQLNRMKVEKAIWNKLKLTRILPWDKIGDAASFANNYGYRNVFGGYSWNDSHDRAGGADNNQYKEELTGLKLRLFAPKTNPYIGSQLPVSGKCIKKVMVADDENWYLFQLNSPVHFNDYLKKQVIIRHKNEGESLLFDKVEILFMFIPNERLLLQRNIDIRDLRYADRAYSRPLNE